jgi:membrane fusion protein, multidrug efflux system
MIGTLLALSAIGVVVYASNREAPLKGLAGFGKRGGGAGASGGDFPTPVLVGEAKLADVPVVLEGVGTVKALNTVTVKALVEGKIQKFNFAEGQFVKKGDVLVEIDAAPYQASYDQTVAKKLVNETLLGNAKRDSDRYSKVSAGVISQKVIDTQEALVRQLTAQVAADAAAVASAKTTLDYTKVIAPIGGRTGIRLVDEGNVTRASDQAGIVVITQLQPLTTVFTLPQQQLPQIARAMTAGPVAAEAMDGDNKVALDKGVVTVVDNQVDQTTGTIKLKAEFPNAKLQLWPGQFVNLRILVDTLTQVIVAPTPAIQRGPNGIYAFVVKSDNTVAQRPVITGLQTDKDSVIRSGLLAGDRVVTTGFARLQDGSKVYIAPPRTESAPAAGAQPSAEATPPTGDRPSGEWKRGEGKGEGRGEGRGEGGKGEGKGEGRRKGEGKGAPASAEAPGAAKSASP